MLDEAESGDSFLRSAPFVAEPVPHFAHSRSAPLIVFASFEDGKITHLADGKRGMSAGTRLSRLNIQGLKPLARPVAFEELESGVPVRVRPHLRRVLSDGGLLPPKTLGAFVDRIIELDASVASRLARFSESRREALGGLKPRAKENLAFQKETLGVALELSGISRDALFEWQPVVGPQRSFLDGLPARRFAKMRCSSADFSTFRDFRQSAR